MQRFKVMALNTLDQLFIHRLAVARGAKGAVIAEPSRAPRNLARFHRRQISPPPSVIFCQPGKGDVVRIQIKSHANGICRDQKINLTRLK